MLLILKIISAKKPSISRQSVLHTIVERFVAWVQVQKGKGGKTGKGKYFLALIPVDAQNSLQATRGNAWFSLKHI